MSSTPLRVADLMVRDVHTLSPMQSLPLAEAMMGLQHIRHIPVIDESRTLVGLITHRDLIAAKISALAPLSPDERSTLELSVPVAKVMRSPVWTIAPDALAVSAARIMRDHKFGCLPVVDDGKLVGILTEFDLLTLISDEFLPAVPLTVERAMTASPITIDAYTTIEQARLLMKENAVNHLPVVVNGRALSLVSERDLRVAELVYHHVEQTCAAHAARLVGTDELHRVSRQASLEAVLRRMFELRVDFAVVEDANGRLVGVLSSLDACRLLAIALGSPPKAVESSAMPTIRRPEHE